MKLLLNSFGVIPLVGTIGFTIGAGGATRSAYAGGAQPGNDGGFTNAGGVIGYGGAGGHRTSSDNGVTKTAGNVGSGGSGVAWYSVVITQLYVFLE